MKAYNFTVVDEFEETIVIPYIGIEIKGWATLVAIVIGGGTGVFVLGTILSFLLGSVGYWVALIVVFACITVYVIYANEINQETGRNTFWEFYYVSLRKYRCVYNSQGEKHYIQTKKKGVKYCNAYRKSIRKRQHCISQRSNHVLLQR